MISLQRLVFAFFFLLPAIGWCQADTVYFNFTSDRTDKTNATKYMVCHKGGGMQFKAETYSAKDDSIISTGYYSVTDSSIKYGHFAFYEHGRVYSEGNYEGNKQVGEWKRYRADQKGPWCTEQYENGELKRLTSYYKDGKIKRKEQHNGSNITGTCYDEKGKEIAFTPFEVQPKPAYSLGEYLNNNLHYPIDAIESDIEGRVIVKFVVGDDGSISGVEVVKNVSASCDKEAARVIANMPAWTPGRMDDKIVSVYFTQPISFKLE